MKFLRRTLVFWPVLYEPSIYWPLDYLFVHYRLWVNRAYEHNNELLQSLYKYNLFLCLFYYWQNTANLFDTSIHLFLLFLFLTIVLEHWADAPLMLVILDKFTTCQSESEATIKTLILSDLPSTDLDRYWSTLCFKGYVPTRDAS